MSELKDVSALVLVGGLGTRLRSVLRDRPKPLAEVNGRPFLAYILDQLERAGVRHAVLCTGYMGEALSSAMGESHGRLELTYSCEEEPLGTGGALLRGAVHARGGVILAMNGDSYFGLDLAAFWTWHREGGHAVSIGLRWVEDASRYGLVEVDESGRIRAFREKDGRSGPGWINGGIYLVARERFVSIPAGRAVSLEREVFPGWCGDLWGFKTEAPFLDIGTPEALASAEAFFRN